MSETRTQTSVVSFVYLLFCLVANLQGNPDVQPGLESKGVSTLLFYQSASGLTMLHDNLLGFQKDVQIKKCFLLSLFQYPEIVHLGL